MRRTLTSIALLVGMNLVGCATTGRDVVEEPEIVTLSDVHPELEGRTVQRLKYAPLDEEDERRLEKADSSGLRGLTSYEYRQLYKSEGASEEATRRIVLPEPPEHMRSRVHPMKYSFTDEEERDLWERAHAIGQAYSANQTIFANEEIYMGFVDGELWFGVTEDGKAYRVDLETKEIDKDVPLERLLAKRDSIRTELDETYFD